jgi:hypothetical protein
LIKRVVAQRGDRKVIAMDSISYVDGADAGHIVVSASHGGPSSARYASSQGLAAVFFNDAGVGKDNAGIAALALLKIPAATVSHLSARIGDVDDTWRHGVISHLNEAARAGGLKVGDRLQDSVGKLLDRD